jgi:hypothetical protein
MNIELHPGMYTDIPAGHSSATLVNKSFENGAFEIRIEGNTERHEVPGTTMKSIMLAGKKAARINNVGDAQLTCTLAP